MIPHRKRLRIRRGGRGVEWSGDACVAHGGQGNRTPGDSASIDLRQRQNPILNVYPEEWPETLNDPLKQRGVHVSRLTTSYARKEMLIK